MTSSAQTIRNTITLKGSTEIITEFFGFSINSILYQRGIYPSEDFIKVKKYDLPMVVTKDEGLKNYLQEVLTQLSQWLINQEVQKLVLVVSSVDTKEVLERWVFDIQAESPPLNGKPVEKPVKEIMSEIKALIRQITASVSFLPLLTDPCTFDLLVYTNADVNVPQAWEESDPKYITKSREVRLRSFTTKVHKIDSLVAFKDDED